MIIGPDGALWDGEQRVFRPVPRRFQIPGEAFPFPRREAPLMERIQRAKDRIFDLIDREIERFDHDNERENLLASMRVQVHLIRVLPGAVLREAYQVVRGGRETRIAATVCIATAAACLTVVAALKIGNP